MEKIGPQKSFLTINKISGIWNNQCPKLSKYSLAYINFVFDQFEETLHLKKNKLKEKPKIKFETKILFVKAFLAFSMGNYNRIIFLKNFYQYFLKIMNFLYFYLNLFLIF